MNRFKSFVLSVAAIGALALVTNIITAPTLALAEGGGGGGYSHDGEREGPSEPKGDNHGNPKPHDPKPEPEQPKPQRPNFLKNDNSREVASPSVCLGHSADHKSIVAGMEADLAGYYDRAIAEGKWVVVSVNGGVVTGPIFRGQSAQGKKWKMTQRPADGHVCVKPIG